MALPKRTPFQIFSALALAALVASCGLGRDSGGDGRTITDPIVAATVNGRPIYIEDVRAHAVARGLLREGEDLNANSDAFYFALDELIQFRLFAMEAEARGLDRDPHVRRQLEIARERVLAAAIYEEIDQRATDQAAIERLYRENTSRLGGGEEVRLRQITFQTREEADAALRRLSQGERFEAIAFEQNIDGDGGDLGFRAVADMLPHVREAVGRANVGQLIGPLQTGDVWQIMRIDDRREGSSPSLETMRPRIIDWLRFQEISQLQERLERDARIERQREDNDPGMAPTEETPAPADAQPQEPLRPAPDAGASPGQAPPPFPFPMGPGGVTSQPQPQSQTPAPAQPQAPRPQTPPPAAPATTNAAPAEASPTP
ncbi:MAG: peptidyl-prolyl cis-trans isomerase [Hyphomonadaceae bacterium]|nr:peptidyl-prolyl cis-trans isomerase [Hyphomonadaceae bacterium]MBX3510628.1 peptidyl-prolyl cis-trans isomerase [Hyphomonadaceae bacterium]